MSPLRTLVNFIYWASDISAAFLRLVILLLVPWAGCTGDGPTVSSISQPSDAIAGQNSTLAPISETAGSAEDEDPIITLTSTLAGTTAHLTWNPPPDMKVTGYSVYYRKRSPEEPRLQENSSEELVSEEIISEAFGLEETNPGANSDDVSPCSDGEYHATQTPPAVITGLAPNTQYFFSILAFTESETLCSNEIVVVTPPAES